MTASSFAMTSTLTQGEQSVAAKVKRTNTAESFPLCVGGGGGGGRRKKEKETDFLKVGQRQSGRQSQRVSMPFLLMTYLLQWRNNVCIHTTHAIAVYIFTSKSAGPCLIIMSSSVCSQPGRIKTERKKINKSIQKRCCPSRSGN